ncbi:MAG: S8 family serine peptidase, partial [Halioglobus sp.]|nr:S8 family serine peptidase [Halioglobus sp.]
TADADLYLYDNERVLVDASLDTGEIESVMIEQDGTYFINASIFSGATNYTLAIGSAELLATGAPARHEIVPWEAVVVYNESAADAAGDGGRALRERMALAQRAGVRGSSRLLALRRDVALQQQRARRLGRAIHKQHSFRDEALRARWETLLTIKSLRRDPQVRFAAPNYRVRPLATPNDEAYPLQWHYPLIGLPQAWDTTTGDENTIVAVIDTGVLPGHPDLLGQFVDGYDFVSDAGNAGDGNGIDPVPTDPGDGLGGNSSFHGTHVSGTVVARGNNDRGVAGVAYTSRVMPLRALGIEGGTSYDLEQALRYAGGLANDSEQVPAQAADIINLSLGGAGFSPGTQSLIQQLRDRGIVIVAAAGNEASSQPSYPAAYPGVISVSAIDAQRRLAPYSNIGPTIDVAAPGGNNSVDVTGDGYPDGVLSTGGSDGSGGANFVYSFLNGTSMAAPHVAGVIALMKSINPALDPGDIDALLESGAITEDLGAAGRDNLYGHGMISAQLAVLEALQSIGSSPADNPRLVTSAATLNFGASTTQLELALSNGGSGDLAVTGVNGSESWLTVAPSGIDASGFGDYLVSVDRSGLDAGVYSADITAVSTVNTVNVRVFVSVGGDNFASDVGVLYVLLIDPQTNQPVAQDESSGAGGVYEFELEDIAPGQYEIIAGSDADNDLLICDPGESCGAYLTLDKPVLVEVSADAAGFDFPAEYLVALPNLDATSNAGGQATRPTRRTPQRSPR